MSSLFFSNDKGSQMAQSRYLFAISCFQMDLLTEAEAALCPINEPGAEVLIKFCVCIIKPMTFLHICVLIPFLTPPEIGKGKKIINVKAILIT